MAMRPAEVYAAWMAYLTRGERDGFDAMLAELRAGELVMETRPEGHVIRERYQPCCEDFATHMQFECDVHESPYACPDVVLVGEAGAWFGIPVHDGGESSIRIRFCPWCGMRLPWPSGDQ